MSEMSEAQYQREKYRLTKRKSYYKKFVQSQSGSPISRGRYYEALSALNELERNYQCIQL